METVTATICHLVKGHSSPHRPALAFMQPWVFILWGCSQAEPAGEVPPSFAALGLGRETAEEGVGLGGFVPEVETVRDVLAFASDFSIAAGLCFPKRSPCCLPDLAF